MYATNSLAGTFIVLLAIVSLTLVIAYGNSREPASRERHPTVTAADAGLGFAPRGQRTRVLSATPPVAVNSGRIR
jgi:hypothetical protein